MANADINHIKMEVKEAAQKVNPLKASKRASKKDNLQPANTA